MGLFRSYAAIPIEVSSLFTQAISAPRAIPEGISTIASAATLRLSPVVSIKTVASFIFQPSAPGMLISLADIEPTTSTSPVLLILMYLSSLKSPVSLRSGRLSVP